MNAKAISENSSADGCIRPFMIVFGAVFFLVGIGLFWGTFVVVVWRANAAKNWPEAPCVIISSEIRTHSDSDGTSYTPEIRYRYTLDGGELESSRYGFMQFGGSFQRAQKIVDQFPAGSNAVCFYDPRNPSYAVLNRTLGWSLLIGLVPLIFAIIGGGIIYFGIFGNVKSRRRRVTQIRNSLTSKIATAVTDTDRFEGPQKLRPAESRFATFVGFSLFALFWNGILSVFIVQLIRQPMWALGLFLIPFVVVGIGMIFGAIYQLMAMTNPKVEVALSNGAIPLGESIDIAWQLTGRTSRIRKLKVSIEGIEQATYTRGTSTYTDKSTFKTISLFDGENPAEIRFGARTVQIPSATMHTFIASKNKIIWLVKVHGEIAWWPDINDFFEFFVKPMAVK